MNFRMFLFTRYTEIFVDLFILIAYKIVDLTDLIADFLLLIDLFIVFLNLLEKSMCGISRI